ncbi:HNH endonuclease, partial [Akkermansiaceae bacterium]|nr:HNH endonuclease [Akkermansiaceae bacterium]
MARWTRNELLQALNLYHRTPFGKQHSTYTPIVALAEKLGRTPGSIAMKLSNLTSLDAVEQERGIKGLSGASKLDREIWAEFENNLPALAEESEPLLEPEPKEPA